MSLSLPEPIAQGDLGATPFAHALLTCHHRGVTGTLAVWPEDPQVTPGQDRIRLVHGHVVAARFLGRAVALDRGLLPLFGRTRGAYALYPDVDLVGSREPARTGQIDPRMIVAASLRGPSRDDVVLDVLAVFGDAPVRIRPNADFGPLALLPKEAAFLDVVRGGPASVAELAEDCELGPSMGRRLLYLLTITDALEAWTGATQVDVAARGRRISSINMVAVVPPGAPSTRPPSEPGTVASPTFGAGVTPGSSASPPRSTVPPAGAVTAGRPRSITPPAPAPRMRREAPEPPPPAPTTGLSAEHAAFWSEVSEAWAKLDGQTYFDMLGVAKEADTEAVRKAYFAEVKKWHPDRVPTPVISLRPWVEQIFLLKTQAHETLADERRRAAYVGQVAEGGGTPAADRELAAIVQSAMDQQKAEVMLKRRDFAGAIAVLRGAIELAPTEADPYDTLAWAMYQSPDGDAREMLRTIERAAELAPKNDRIQLHLALILRKAGRETDAIAAFQRAAAFNPRNVEAQRELRVAQMRGSLPAPADAPVKPPEGGLFGRLFSSAPKKEK